MSLLQFSSPFKDAVWKLVKFGQGWHLTSKKIFKTSIKKGTQQKSRVTSTQNIE